MELRNYDELFCSNLIRQAFEQGSGGNFLMPAFATRFDHGPDDFLRRIGVTAKATIAPGDLELEPDLQAIAEWRDFARTSQIRLHDFVMVKLFEWMAEESYTFHENLFVRVISRLGRASAYVPWPLSFLLSRFIPKVPMNMQRSTISAIAMLHGTAEPLFKELEKMEIRSVRQRGYPLHPREILEQLEVIRARSPKRLGYLRQDL